MADAFFPGACTLRLWNCRTDPKVASSEGSAIKRSLPKLRQRRVAQRLLKLREAADYLNIPVTKLAPYLKLKGNARLPGRKVRGRWEIDLEEFQDWLLNLYEARKGTPIEPENKRLVNRRDRRSPRDLKQQ